MVTTIITLTVISAKKNSFGFASFLHFFIFRPEKCFNLSKYAIFALIKKYGRQNVNASKIYKQRKLSKIIPKLSQKLISNEILTDFNTLTTKCGSFLMTKILVFNNKKRCIFLQKDALINNNFNFSDKFLFKKQFR